MPPRVRLAPSLRRQSLRCQRELRIARSASSAAATAAVTPAAPIGQMMHSPAPISRFPPTQPPSHRNPEYRRSQLLRSYASLLRTSPLIVIFQHHNLKSMEWSSIRRELATAMQKVDDRIAAEGRTQPPLAPNIKLQTVQTRIFEVALRVVEYFRPNNKVSSHASLAQPPSAVNPATQTSAEIPLLSGSRDDPALTHDLSRTARDAVKHMKGKHELSNLLVGSVAVLSIPTVSPEHMRAALAILTPKETKFTAPTRKANPAYHEPIVQNGLQKISLLAARVDGKVHDVEGTKWIGSIEGGMDGLRAQLVGTLESIGLGVTNTLEGASKSIYFTMEGLKGVLEDQQKGPDGEKKGDSS